MIKYSNRKVIEVQDWDKLVEETYGRPYSFQQQDGCKDRGIETIVVPSENNGEDLYTNDNIPEIINGDIMGVSFKAWLVRDPKAPLNPSKKELKDCGYYWGKSEKEEKEWKQDQEHINIFYERNFYPDVNMVADDLYKKGLLEAGEYDINIDW